MDDNLTKCFHNKQVNTMIVILLIKPCQWSPWSIGSRCCYVVYAGDCYTWSFLQDDGGGGGPGGGGGGGGGGAPIRGGGTWNINIKKSHVTNRLFPHSCKQRHQREAWVDKIQWFVWNCLPEPHPHFFTFAHWSVMQGRSISVVIWINKPANLQWNLVN